MGEEPAESNSQAGAQLEPAARGTLRARGQGLSIRQASATALQVAQNCSRGVAGPGGHQQEEQVYHSLRPGSFIPDLLQGRKGQKPPRPSPTKSHTAAQPSLLCFLPP